jgi:hypothetical protein
LNCALIGGSEESDMKGASMKSELKRSGEGSKTVKLKKGESPKQEIVLSVPGDPELWDRIALKAYELYEGRGKAHGHDLEDWIRAEQMVLKEIRS